MLFESDPCPLTMTNVLSNFYFNQSFGDSLAWWTPKKMQTQKKNAPNDSLKHKSVRSSHYKQFLHLVIFFLFQE